MRTFITLAVIGFGWTLITCAGCRVTAHTNTPFEGYTQWNIHYSAANNTGSVTNWTEFAGHDFIPVNTRVSAKSIGNWIYITSESESRVRLSAKSAYMNMSRAQYIEMLLAPAPMDVSAMSDIDRKGISDAKVHMGMSKEGVKAALGYPAAHKTPSLDNDTWMYWKDRFGRRKVRFDANGKVVEFTRYK